MVSEQELESIEQNTKEQSDSDMWMIERRKQITASVVGGIAKIKRKHIGAQKLRTCCIASLEEVRLQGMGH